MKRVAETEHDAIVEIPAILRIRIVVVEPKLGTVAVELIVFGIIMPWHLAPSIFIFWKSRAPLYPEP